VVNCHYHGESTNRSIARKRQFKASTHLPPTGYYRLSELPIGETLARKLINEKILFSVLVGVPGSKRGTRLVSAKSFDAYIRSLASGQIEVKGGTPPARKQTEGKAKSQLAVEA
jgi:hypothetical protein